MVRHRRGDRVRYVFRIRTRQKRGIRTSHIEIVKKRSTYALIIWTLGQAIRNSSLKKICRRKTKCLGISEEEPSIPRTNRASCTQDDMLLEVGNYARYRHRIVHKKYRFQAALSPIKQPQKDGLSAMRLSDCQNLLGKHSSFTTTF